MSPSHGRLSPLLVALGLLAAASVAGQVIGAANGNAGLSTFAAAAFAGGMIRVAWQTNRAWWDGGVARLEPDRSDAEPFIARSNARLFAIGYIWGGLSLLAVYLLSGVRWQHGWQYGSGMVLIGFGIWLMAGALTASWDRRTARTLFWGTALHAVAALGAAGWLIASGKLASVKGDWPANVVFLAGAAGLIGVSAFALQTARSFEIRS